MLRILLVAPGLGLHTTAEVRDLTSLHRVTVLSDFVTARDVYVAARSGYEVIHYAGHSNDQYVEVSGENLVDNDLLQIARISGAKLVFFNSCSAGRLAHYLVGHGVPLAVHTNKELPDIDAWKFPNAFYGAVVRLGNGRTTAYIHAFDEANDGEGLYGLAIAPSVALTLAAPVPIPPPARVPFSRQQWLLLAGVTLLVTWLLILSLLATWR